MQYLRRFGAWLLRAWPALMLVPVGVIHALALVLFSTERIFVNKLTGTLLQIGGGLIVLLALDGNLGLFKQQGLFKAFVLYLKDFPRFGDRIALMGGAALGGSLSVSGSLSVVHRTATTLEERVAELERRLKEEAERLRKLEATTAERLTNLTSELSSSISAVDGGLRELSQRVERTAIGGLKQQLFGVFVAIYGACVSVFA